MEDDHNMEAGESVGTMVTALAWVGRGYARPVLDNFEPSQSELEKHQKVAGKLLKGKGKNQEISDAVKEAEMKMDEMEIDSDQNSDDDNAPIFTPELARLKAKEKG